MLDHGVTSIPVEMHHTVSMVGLMDILVHTVETFDKLNPGAKPNDFMEKFNVSTEQLTGVLEPFSSTLSNARMSVLFIFHYLLLF